MVDPSRQRGLNWGEIIEESYGVAEMVITWDTARERCIGGVIMESTNTLPENKTTCNDTWHKNSDRPSVGKELRGALLSPP